ncbi:MAG: hypothetical protein K8R35_07000 [Bacteroidales bacterium]|nr:hypothetical protein [Bacteroidales bacterium]
MRPVITPVLFFVLMFSYTGCTKENEYSDHGTDTIDNIIFGTTLYYAIGFSFELGTLVHTNEIPEPDITVHANASPTSLSAYLDTPNLIESYTLLSENDSEADAKTFFDSFLEVGSYNWSLFATNVMENQVWLFKTREGNYVKLRIIDLLVEETSGPPYARVTFEWRIQKDGSTKFTE